MKTGIKINTALVICAAFIFRLLFVNIGFINSQNTQHNQHSVKKHFSSDLKRRKGSEFNAQTVQSTYSVVEICEEVTDEETESKLSPLKVVQILFSFLSSSITSGFSKFYASNWHSPYPCSDRYLSLQVIRI